MWSENMHCLQDTLLILLVVSFKNQSTPYLKLLHISVLNDLECIGFLRQIYNNCPIETEPMSFKYYHH